MHDATHPGKSLASNENKKETIADSGWIVTSLSEGRPIAAERRRSCSFIAAEGWTYGRGDPFCDAPALPDSSYCERHRALCEIAPHSPAGLAAAHALVRTADIAPPPPADLAFLSASAPPEVDAEAEPKDIAACLDLPAEDRRNGEG